MGKTGTSSIQSFLNRNRTGLTDAGILYPRTPGLGRHVRLGLSFQPDNRLDGLPAWRRLGCTDPQAFRTAFQRQLFKEIDEAGSSLVLLSDEGLYGLPDESLRNLGRFVRRIGRTARVVVYLRRQDDHLVSHYQQVVKKRGETRRLVDRIRQADYSKIHDYHARLRSWQRLAEPDVLTVRRFEPDLFAGGSLLEDFFESAALEAPIDGFKRVQPRNESLGAESVEFLRIVNLLRKQDPAAKVLPPGDVMVSQLRKLNDGPTLTAPKPLLDELMGRWEASNKAVAHEFIGDGEPLFRTPRKTRNTTTEQRLEPARLEQFIALLELPDQVHAPLRALAKREARVV